MKATFPADPDPRGRRSSRQRGLSLVVAMLTLSVICFASVSLMRRAIDADLIADGDRTRTQAFQSAQLALRFCERQPALPPHAREVPVLAPSPQPAWTRRAAWAADGASMAHTLTARDSSAAIPPHAAPQCMVESTAVPSVFTVTARGFGADVAPGSAMASGRAGAVVWLQSTLLLAEPAAMPPASASDSPRTAPRRRVWQQLLTPPF